VLLVGGTLALLVLSSVVAFEWGRSRAGFDGRAARAERGELRGQIEDLQKQLRAQRLKLATYESERVGQTRERSELARSIGELQAEVAQLTSDLAFYKGVVGDRSTPARVIKIQQFRVTRGAAANEYLLRLVLGRPLRPEDSINGRIRMTFEGTTAATPVNLDLAAVGGVAGGELPFNYRYVQTVEQVIHLPPGFAPSRTTVELIPLRKGVNPVRETFLWTVEN
jgi:hypothetical protein